MNNDEFKINISDGKVDTSPHIASTIQADTLFTFTRKLEYLLEWIISCKLPPRYNIENIEYLNIPNIPSVGFPMKCFCDINLHRLKSHLNSYGHFGLAFKKEWGMKRGIQPVHYINKDSMLCKDISQAVGTLFRHEGQTNVENLLLDYTVHNLMFYKPYSGVCNEKEKCFADECEWRYVPNVTTENNLPQIIINNLELKDEYLDELSNYIKKFAISFKPDDVKYIIIEKENDLCQLIKELKKMKEEDCYQLLSKVIIWDESEGDF